MKKPIYMLIQILLGVFLSAAIFAQAPDAFKYQAVVRDASGNLVTNQNVSFEIKIHQGSSSGTVVYSETHSATTNAYGMVCLEIGSGIPSGNLASVNWSAYDHFMEFSVDLTGGSSYNSLGSVQMLSVPYALHAKTTENVNDADADPNNEIQNLNLSGHNLTITDGNTVTLPDDVNDADANPSNELQTLSISGNSLSISSGNTVTLPSPSGGNTLDGAYDQGGAGAGRIITADAGSIVIAGHDGLEVYGDIDVGLNNATDNDRINFDDSTPEYLEWNETDNEFYLSDDLQLGYGNRISNVNSPTVYNAFSSTGTSTPASSEMTSAGDVFVEFDLEVGDDLITHDLTVNGTMNGRVPGISQGKATSVTINNTSSMADVVTTTITIPGPGYILVESDGQLSIGSITTANYIMHQIDETAGGSYNSSYFQVVGYNKPANTDISYLDASNRRTYYKTSSGTYTFRWEAMSNTSSGYRVLHRPVITATYIPSAFGTVSAIIPESESSGFNQKIPVQINDDEIGQTVNVSENYYQVDLKELQDKEQALENSKSEK